MDGSTDPSETLLLSPLFVGCLAWGVVVISFGHRELNGTWPAGQSGMGVALFAGLGLALLGYGVVTRAKGSVGTRSTGE